MSYAAQKVRSKSSSRAYAETKATSRKGNSAAMYVKDQYEEYQFDNHIKTLDILIKSTTKLEPSTISKHYIMLLNNGMNSFKAFTFLLTIDQLLNGNIDELSATNEIEKLVGSRHFAKLMIEEYRTNAITKQ